MTSHSYSTMQEIDQTLARILRRVRQMEARVANDQIAVRVYPRTRIPGPLSYARMSTGRLAMSAFAGAAVYHWSCQEQNTFKQELQSRGFKKSLDTWHGEAVAGEGGLATPRFDFLAEHIVWLTNNTLDNLAGAIDEVIVSGDSHVLMALSPSELIDDMRLAGMDTEAIMAFEEGVGTSTVSPTEQIDIQIATYTTKQEDSTLAYEESNEHGMIFQ